MFAPQQTDVAYRLLHWAVQQSFPLCFVHLPPQPAPLQRGESSLGCLLFHVTPGRWVITRLSTVSCHSGEVSHHSIIYCFMSFREGQSSLSLSTIPCYSMQVSHHSVIYCFMSLLGGESRHSVVYCSILQGGESSLNCLLFHVTPWRWVITQLSTLSCHSMEVSNHSVVYCFMSFQGGESHHSVVYSFMSLQGDESHHSVVYCFMSFHGSESSLRCLFHVTPKRWVILLCCLLFHITPVR